MVLYNQTKKTTLATNLEEATAICDKFLGLLNKKNSRSLLFKTRFGIHTFFLKEQIDVLILDSQSRVVTLKTLRPNQILIYNPIYSTVIELPENTISTSKTSKGDRLKITLNRHSV